MGDVTDIASRARHAGQVNVEQALADALASHREAPAVRAVVVLARQDGDGIYIEPHAAGVNMAEALGLLELAKAELLLGGD